ncbi:MAG TPA: response regulator [Anaerolineales bacterium]|nr:response regulator [Anaerolineales bacterium]
MRILVVDDDLLNQQLMQILLEQEGHHVEAASNGLEAFESIKRQQFDIVFMDLNMPVMDGRQASRRIREWENGSRRTFIVALTASYLPDERQGLREAGVDNYIAKPFEVRHIQQLLRDRIDIRSFPSTQRIPPDEGLDR